MRPYGLAKFGQRRAVQAAVEQWTPQLSLEPLDGVGQRGLRDAATFGRQREILIAAKSQEISDVVHLHECAPWVRRRFFANAQIGYPPQRTFSVSTNLLGCVSFDGVRPGAILDLAALIYRQPGS